MEVRLLGPVELVGDDGAIVAVGGPKERALLAVLASHRDQVLSEDRLVDALWGDVPPRTATRTLQSYLSRLRRTVPIESGPGGWVLRLPSDAIDIARVEALAEKGRAAFERGDCLGAALALADALRHWRGRPLEEFADRSWAIVESSRLDELHQTIAERRAEAELACGRHAELVGELEALCRTHPLRERSWGQLMLALYRSGRQAEALRVYQELRTTLRDELGVEPSPALVRLEQQILLQDTALEWHPPDEGRPPARPPVGEWTEPVLALFPSFLEGLAGVTFVGRDNELDLLAQTWALARNGQRQVALIAGEPGIGKTTLAARAAAAARPHGALVLFGRCDEESLLAFQPFVEAIGAYVDAAPPAQLRSVLGPQAGDLALLLPNVGRRLPEVAGVVGTGAETERYRIFEAVVSLFAGLGRHAPIVLVLDDLHWADRPTLGLFQHLIRRSNDVPLLMLGTYRDTDLVRTHPMAETLARLRRADLVSRVPLRGLARPDVLSLVSGGSTVVPEDIQLAEALFDETEGSPLFIREILRHLEESGAVFRDEQGRWIPHRRIDQLGIPEGLREVLGRRLSRLSDAANVALRTGSVLGRQIRLDVLEIVTDLSTEELLDALDEATVAGVIEEVPSGVGRWTYTHALVRHALYEELSLSRRVRLHQRVGEALETLEPGDGPYLAELAYHFSQAAVSGTADKAIAYAWQAGEYSVKLAAYEQAARHFEMALEVAEDAGTDHDLQADLLLAKGDAEWRTGDIRLARATIEQSIALIGDRDPERLAHAALNYAGAGMRPVWIDLGAVNTRTIDLLESALSVLADEDTELRALLLGCLAQELYFMPGAERRRDNLSAAAVSMARRLGDPKTVAYTLNARFLAVIGPDTAAEQMANATEMLGIARSLDDRQIEALALRQRNVADLGLNDLAGLVRDLDRFDALVGQLKDPIGRAYTILFRAGLKTMEGRFGDAEALCRDGFERAREARDPNAITIGAMPFVMIRLLQGRLAETVGTVQAAIELYSGLRALADAMLAGMFAELGMTAEAQVHLDRADPNLTGRNALWLFIEGWLALAAYRLDDRAKAAEVYSSLLPYEDQNAGAISVGFGSVHFPLALTATTTGQYDDAASHFEAAIAANVRNGWRPLVTLNQIGYAGMLSRRAADGDREKAVGLLEEALVTASDLGMAAAGAEARSLRDRLLGVSPPAEGDRRRRSVTRRDRAKSKVTIKGRAAVARWTRGDPDEELIKRFGTSVAQRTLFTALAHAFQPAMAHGFSGDLVFELRPPRDNPDPAASDWWTIEVRGHKATARRGQSPDPVVGFHAGVADFVRLAAGELHPVRALFEGTIEIGGDFMIAARLPELFGAVEPIEGLAQAATR